MPLIVSNDAQISVQAFLHRTHKTLCLPKRNTGEGLIEWEFGLSRCKLLCLGWINSKVLLYSSGSNIQYPVIKHNGEEHEQECISVYNLKHFAVQQKLTQHYKSTILQ